MTYSGSRGIGVAGWLRQHSGAALGLLHSAGWVVADQAFVSATNFLGMVIAARTLTTGDFGAYVLAYTGIWALNGIQSSLITQPHSVLASHTDTAAYRRYTSASALMQVGLSGILGLPLLIAGLLAQATGAGPSLLAAGAAVIAWQAQEFLRRVLFFEGRRSGVFALDVISFGGQLAVIIALASTGRFSVTSGLLAAAATSGVAAIVGVVLLRSTLFHSPMLGAIGRNVAHGRWLLGAEVGAFISSSSYPFLLAATTGAEAVAVYSAAMLLLNPLNIIWFAVGTALPIQLSRARQRLGERASRRELGQAYRLSVPIVGLYCLAAALLGGSVLGLVFGPAYADFGWVVAIAAAIRVLGYHSHLLSVGLRVHHQTRSIFTGYVIAMPFSLIVGTMLTVAYGIAGALAALFVAHLIWTIVWARAYGPDDADQPETSS